MRQQADRLAAAGYLTILPDLYSAGGARRCLRATFAEQRHWSRPSRHCGRTAVAVRSAGLHRPGRRDRLLHGWGFRAAVSEPRLRCRIGELRPATGRSGRGAGGGVPRRRELWRQGLHAQASRTATRGRPDRSRGGARRQGVPQGRARLHGGCCGSTTVAPCAQGARARSRSLRPTPGLAWRRSSPSTCSDACAPRRRGRFSWRSG